MTAIVNNQMTTNGKYKALSVNMSILSYLLLLFIYCILKAKASNTTYPNCSTSEHICIPAFYNKDEAPSQKTICLVTVSFVKLRVLKVNNDDSTITLSLELQLIWRDDRLKLAKDSTSLPIKLPTFYHDQIWIPDIFIFGLHDVKMLELINEYDYLYKLNNTHLAFTDAFEVKIFCKMDYHGYPFDHQNCPFRLSSYSNDETKLKFDTNIIDYKDDDQVSLIQYSIDVEPLPNSRAKVEHLSISGKVGLWSVTGFVVKLRRQTMQYKINYFIPSGILVIASWVIVLK